MCDLDIIQVLKQNLDSSYYKKIQCMDLENTAMLKIENHKNIWKDTF